MEERQLPYFLVANWYISKAIHKCGQECIGKFQWHMVHMYIHDTLITKMLKLMSNGTPNDKQWENCGLTTLCQEAVQERLIRIGFKYNYTVNNYYVGGHENKDMIRYIWNFIDRYILLERCMFIWIQMTAKESDKYKGWKHKCLFQGQYSITRDATPITTPTMLLIW